MNALEWSLLGALLLCVIGALYLMYALVATMIRRRRRKREANWEGSLFPGEIDSWSPSDMCDGGGWFGDGGDGGDGGGGGD